MTTSRLSIAAVWSDNDLLEIETFVCHHAWSGAERAYTTRDDLSAFAHHLGAMVEGSSTASFDAGQPDLGFVSCRVFEYGAAHHVAMEVRIGHGRAHVANRLDCAREVRLTAPVERGQLAAFAAEIRHMVQADAGCATLPIPVDSP